MDESSLIVVKSTANRRKSYTLEYKKSVVAALKNDYNGNVSQAAKSLGLTRQNIYDFVKLFPSIEKIAGKSHMVIVARILICFLVDRQETIKCKRRVRDPADKSHRGRFPMMEEMLFNW